MQFVISMKRGDENIYWDGFGWARLQSSAKRYSSGAFLAAISFVKLSHPRAYGIPQGEPK